MIQPKPGEQQVQIQVDPSKANPIHFNASQISHNPQEFLIEFLSIFPPQGLMAARLVASPENYKKMVIAMEGNLATYEKVNGIINIKGAIETPTMPKIIKP